MRNVFDQYSQPENRLTHALATCLHRDAVMLRAFVSWAAGSSAPTPGELHVVEQSVPGVAEPSEDDQERRGLPDMWIHDAARWSLLIESKVQAGLIADQIKRHRRTAERCGFEDVSVLALVPGVDGKRECVDGVVRTWPEVYAWAQQRCSTSPWAGTLVEYMEILEARMVADGYLTEGTITRFAGVPFDDERPYNYLEAKRLLRLMLEELRKRGDVAALGADCKARGRHAITGKDVAWVWAYLPLRAARGVKPHTRFPHLTLSLQLDHVHASVTVPNGIRRDMRRRLVGLGTDNFRRLLTRTATDIARATRKVDGAAPHVGLLQRHYPSQRSTPIVDGELDFDLRAILPTKSGKVRPQPQWVDAAFNLIDGRDSNQQINVGARLPYGDAVVRSEKVVEVVAAVWIACRPWLELLVGGRTRQRPS